MSGYVHDQKLMLHAAPPAFRATLCAMPMLALRLPAASA
jgi:hypothetical protein